MLLRALGGSERASTTCRANSEAVVVMQAPLKVSCVLSTPFPEKPVALPVSGSPRCAGEFEDGNFLLEDRIKEEQEEHTGGFGFNSHPRSPAAIITHGRQKQQGPACICAKA